MVTFRNKTQEKKNIPNFIPEYSEWRPERAHIVVTLKETGWVLAGPNDATKELGLNRSTMQFRIKSSASSAPKL